ncbi:hypothetical protein SAMN05444008_12369 [Cnuella takakiae]|uniref:Uncharacterized protein n=1 Tax=Cnuella takakiae TaxID=1302690 RepID=A0A1M5IFS5_9BACT|nr:DUF5522 domain-containing protein [Cnuella takakiae]OLY90835.1 hypothetical protein BUE76_02160 [Cnuella takakiae]SHG27127.1 hypothetical protein SAMN05444008_12369 [Cnuella takakiae]
MKNLKPQPVLKEGVDYYLNEQGLMVLTEKYHLDRGYCCGNGCKHCPFDFEAVPEPKRSELLEKKSL